MASASLLPCAIWLPYAAITFQRAPPEVNGFGVITWTPGLTRSSQPLMFLGLPLRTASTTTESVTMPLYWLAFQLLSTSPLSTSRVMSGSSENSTTSAGQAAVDRAALVARRAVGLVEGDALALGRLLERRDQGRVRLLRRRVGDEADLVAAGPARATTAAGDDRGKRGDEGYDGHQSGRGLSHLVRFPVFYRFSRHFKRTKTAAPAKPSLQSNFLIPIAFVGNRRQTVARVGACVRKFAVPSGRGKNQREPASRLPQ